MKFNGNSDFDDIFMATDSSVHSVNFDVGLVLSLVFFKCFMYKRTIC